MLKNFKHFLHLFVNLPLGLVGLELLRRRPFTDYRDYIPFKETIAEAQKADLPVGDYIDLRYNKPGTTQEAIDRMVGLGVFQDKIERVCEIGPGSGRYLEKTLKACSPTYYEIYETATDWKNWLVQKYSVIAHPTDGRLLAHTPSNSIDLVQAHKVISGQPSLVICCYFAEMARITKVGGKVVFDIVTEDCMDDVILEKWLATRSGYQHYPCLVPKQFAIDFFGKRGFSFDGSFFTPMEPGKTECLVFTRTLAKA